MQIELFNGNCMDQMLFMGSGSTGRAALLEGFNFVGAEMDEAFFSIAKARISAVQQGGS